MATGYVPKMAPHGRNERAPAHMRGNRGQGRHLWLALAGGVTLVVAGVTLVVVQHQVPGTSQGRSVPHSNQAASPPQQQAAASVPQAPGQATPVAGQGPVVCIDPGHPSENNSGRTVQNGITELEVNWKVALLLQRNLEQAGVRVVMTRQTMGQYITNKDRAAIANRAGAALFYRIHADTGAGRGVTSYYPARQGTKYGVTGPSQAVIRASAEAARVIHPYIAAATRAALRDNGIRTEGATFIGGKQGALTGSIFSQVPTVLTEMCVLSNRSDARFIKSQAGQRQMAKGMADGILAFLGRLALRPSRTPPSTGPPAASASAPQAAAPSSAVGAPVPAGPAAPSVAAAHAAPPPTSRTPGAARAAEPTQQELRLDPPRGSVLSGKRVITLLGLSALPQGTFLRFEFPGQAVICNSPFAEWDTHTASNGRQTIRVVLFKDNVVLRSLETEYQVKN